MLKIVTSFLATWEQLNFTQFHTLSPKAFFTEDQVLHCHSQYTNVLFSLLLIDHTIVVDGCSVDLFVMNVVLIKWPGKI